jgi:hypothetical protein
MTEAETLHKRKMQLKNDIVKPLVTLIDRGLDVPHILQTLTREAQAGDGKGNLKQGQNRDKSGK